MQDLNNKVDNAGATADGKLSSSEWNEVASESQSLIESTGQTLTSSDLFQVVKGISKYCTAGDFYTGAGAANSYTATVVAPMIAPDSLAVGMKIRAIVSATNTGNSTLNAFSTGAIDIMQPGGTHVASGELVNGTEYEFIYRTSPSTHWEVLDALPAAIEGLSIQGLDFPTIDAVDNRLIVTPSAATSGGTVTYPAGTLISLAEEVTAGETGRMSAYKTVIYTSVDLDVSSTYYLRAKWVSGAVVQYFQKGADTDAMPASLVGTPGGASGGGFDSTVLDILLARVVTGVAGTIPVVTELANNKTLLAHINVEEIAFTGNKSWSNIGLITLDWARTPIIESAALWGLSTDGTTGIGAGNTNTQNFRMIGVRQTGTDRYDSDMEMTYWDSFPDKGTIGANFNFSA